MDKYTEQWIAKMAEKKYPIVVVSAPNSRSDYFPYDVNKEQRDLYAGVIKEIIDNHVGAFAEWASDNYWIKEPFPRKTTGRIMWAKYEEGKPDELATTDQLIEIYFEQLISNKHG